MFERASLLFHGQLSFFKSQVVDVRELPRGLCEGDKSEVITLLQPYLLGQLRHNPPEGAKAHSLFLVPDTVDGTHLLAGGQVEGGAGVHKRWRSVGVHVLVE